MSTDLSAPSIAAFDAVRIREDFPILQQQVHGKRLVYLDNANTSQKPKAVIEATSHYYSCDNANVHRATHLLSERADHAYEEARELARKFVNARSIEEIVFTRGCTDGLNLVAQSYGRPRLTRGDEVLVTWMEHHSNIVPWQLVCDQTGAQLRVVPVTDAGELDLEALDELLTERTRILGLIHVSNALGTVNPVRSIIELAHARGVPVLVDGAQAAPHIPIDVQALDCDFYAFSSHKMYGPTGVGVLYGKRDLLNAMPPYQAGGDMIASVAFEKTTYNTLPFKFEAGTPNIAGVVGFGAAIEYLMALDRAAIADHERDLLEYARQELGKVPGVRLIGDARDRAGAVSFVMDGIHPHDIGTIVDREGVAIRTGQHCAQPLIDRYGVGATARASFALYNTREDVDALITALGKVRELLG